MSTHWWPTARAAMSEAEVEAARTALEKAVAARKAANNAYTAANSAYEEAQQRVQHTWQVVLYHQKKRGAAALLQRESLARQHELEKRECESTEADGREDVAKQVVRRLLPEAAAQHKAEKAKAKAKEMALAADKAQREADEAQREADEFEADEAPKAKPMSKNRVKRSLPIRKAQREADEAQREAEQAQREAQFWSSLKPRERALSRRKEILRDDTP